ncbi:MAG: hypothetical protein H6868_06020 [Rhodospirillales bacterium]|nr:hypothetical protein [Rhodospirillales bacterium]
MHLRQNHYPVYVFLFLALIANIVIWSYARGIQAQWLNVPPVPGEKSGAIMALGDPEFAYRMSGIMLQNLGDTGGRSTNLSAYDYDRLGRWLMLMDQWDPRSDFAPYLAAFYFGAVPDTEKLTPVVTYLEKASEYPGAEKWRWLGQAVYLARFRQNDLETAQRLAKKLAAMAEKNDDMPMWARQMPAFIMTAKGEKEAAYDLMVGLLKSRADRMQAAEINFIRDYVCRKVLSEKEAEKNPLCEDLP